MSLVSAHNGWETHTVGPADSTRTVLMLPGALCSAEFFEDVMGEAALAGVRLVAVTVPGWTGTTPLADVSMENYAREIGRVAAELKADVVVGHSVGANYALEMAALGVFKGPVVLLSPSFSREDEFKELNSLDKIGRVPGIGALAWWLALKTVPGQTKKELPPERGQVLADEMKRNRVAFCRPAIRKYFEYLDQYGNLVPRLCASGVRAWVVFGTEDAVGLKDEERRGLEECPTVTLTTVKGTHMFLVEEPVGTAEVIAEAVAAVA